MSERVQRLHVIFARDDRLKYLAHLELMRVWERACKRAGLPLAYSEGFSPRPRLAFAAPLAVGITSDCEQMDLSLREHRVVAEVGSALGAQLPGGLSIVRVSEIAMALPSLQALVHAATYDVDVSDTRTADAWRAAIEALLARDTIPWEHLRDTTVRRYDLRPLIFKITLVCTEAGRAVLRLRLRHDSSGAGRPEQVTRSLGVAEEPLRIHRSGLDVPLPSIARRAYRAAGRTEN